MKELSLHILDIAENSVKAGASLIRIALSETPTSLTMVISDDGCGMKEETVQRATDPFFTTRTTRGVGLGLPFLKLAAEQTGGDMSIVSRHISEDAEHYGTEITAQFDKTQIDFTPLGDIVSTMITLIQGNPTPDFEFYHDSDAFHVCLKTKPLRDVLGDGIALNDPSILSWIAQYLREQYHTNNHKQQQNKKRKGTEL